MKRAVLFLALAFASSAVADTRTLQQLHDQNDASIIGEPAGKPFAKRLNYMFNNLIDSIGSVANLTTPNLTGSYSGGFHAPFTMDFNDTAQSVNGLGGILVAQRLTNSLSTGGRTAITGELFTQAALNTSNPSPNFSGGNFYGIAGAAGGIPGSPWGWMYGGNTVMHLTSAATNWNGGASIEADVLTAPGSSLNYRYGVYIGDIAASSAQGAKVDAGLAVAATFGASGFIDGILFDDTASFPVSPHGNFMMAGIGSSVSRQFRAGFDFSKLTTNWDNAAILLPAIGSGSSGIWFGSSGLGGKINSSATSAGPTVTLAENLLSVSTPISTAGAMTPSVIGGAAANSTLSLRSTAGAGTNDEIDFFTGPQALRWKIDTTGNLVSLGGYVQPGAVAIRSLPICGASLLGARLTVSDGTAYAIGTYGSAVGATGAVTRAVICTNTGGPTTYAWAYN